jgi:uncharacterized protein (TIGR02172 family)
MAKAAAAMTLGEPIALGRTAEIYAWNDTQVLKLFFDWFEFDAIEFEQKMGKAVTASGLPVPAVGDIVQVKGRNGLIYQRVPGVNLWEVLQKQPWRLNDIARLTAQLQAEMHTTNIRPAIPSQRDRLERKIRGASPLKDHQKQSVLEALATLPDGTALCHGDFHPGNILMDGMTVTIIDWIDASRGNPLADVARSTIIALGAAESRQIPNRLVKLLVRIFHATYLKEYFQLRPGGMPEYRRWLPIIAAARLSENIPEIEDWLIDRARSCWS